MFLIFISRKLTNPGLLNTKCLAIWLLIYYLRPNKFVRVLVYSGDREISLRLTRTARICVHTNLLSVGYRDSVPGGKAAGP